MTNPGISRRRYGLLEWLFFLFFTFIHYQGVIHALIRLLQGLWAHWEAAGVLLFFPCRGAGLCVLISLASSLLSQVWIQPGSGSLTVSSDPAHPNTFIFRKSSNLKGSRRLGLQIDQCYLSVPWCGDTEHRGSSLNRNKHLFELVWHKSMSS